MPSHPSAVRASGASSRRDGTLESCGSPARVVLDVASLMERIGHDDSLFEEIRRLYFEETPHLVERMRDGIARGRGEEARRATHRLRGMLATLGADAAAAAAQALEAVLSAERTGAPEAAERTGAPEAAERTGAPEAAAELLLALAQELATLEAALAELESSVRPSSSEVPA